MTAIAALPLAFGHRHARVDHDPDHLAQAIARAVPLRDLSPRGGHRPFVHRAFSVRAAELEITAAAHSPLHGSNHAQAKAIFTLTMIGEKRFLIDGHRHRVRAGHNALMLPGEAFSLETSVCSGVMFSLCPRALASAATTMAGGPERSQPFAPLQRPLELLESHPPQGNLLALLRRTLGLIDSRSGDTPVLPRQMGLDDKILRLIALLIHPQLLLPSPAEDGTFGRRALASFADLISAMRDDLPASWTLTRMEGQSQLSHFRLRQLFRLQFGCTPLAWLRLQRLCWARQRLDDDEGVSLAHLASQCGFSDRAAFLQAFADHFHLRAETVQGFAARFGAGEGPPGGLQAEGGPSLAR